MMKGYLMFVKVIYSWLFFLLLFTINAAGQSNTIDFESDRWILQDAKIVSYLGQKSLTGVAYLKDVELQDGIIEVDMAFEGTRSYAGIIFRMQSELNFEWFYLRPHQTEKLDALQYTPVFNGVAGWQLYNGEGYTAAATIPYQRWVHLKMEISGTQARVYLDNAEKPVLIIDDLKHGVSKGSIGVLGLNNQVHFANFKFITENNLDFPPAPIVVTPDGMIMEWQLSQNFKVTEIDREHYPSGDTLKNITWQNVRSESSGLLDIARYVQRANREGDSIFAKAIIYSDEDQVKKLEFGYSDDISIFLNRNTLFSGKSGYHSRDPYFSGIIGLHDAVYLNLKKGENELLLSVSETFWGWGIICQLENMQRIKIKSIE